MCFFKCKFLVKLQLMENYKDQLLSQRNEEISNHRNTYELLYKSIKEVDELKLRVKELENQLDHSFCGNEQWYTSCLRKMPKCSDCNKKP